MPTGHNGHFSFFINPIKIENQIPKSEIDKSPCDDDHVAQGTYQPLQNQTETKTALEKTHLLRTETKTALVAIAGRVLHIYAARPWLYAIGLVHGV